MSFWQTIVLAYGVVAVYALADRLMWRKFEGDRPFALALIALWPLALVVMVGATAFFLSLQLLGLRGRLKVKLATASEKLKSAQDDARRDQ